MIMDYHGLSWIIIRHPWGRHFVTFYVSLRWSNWTKSWFTTIVLQRAESGCGKSPRRRPSHFLFSLYLSYPLDKTKTASPFQHFQRALTRTLCLQFRSQEVALCLECHKNKPDCPLVPDQSKINSVKARQSETPTG